MRILLVGLIVIVLIVSGCISGTGQLILPSGPCVKGKVNVISKDFDITGFTGFNLMVPANVYVTQDSPSLRIEAEDNIMEILEIGIVGEELRISSSQCFSNTKPLNIYLKMDDVKGLAITGSGKIIGQSMIDSEKVALAISGSGIIDMEVNADELRTNIAGSGNISLSGESAVHNSIISGSGSIHAFDLSTEVTSIRISGSGKCEVDASREIYATITGSGTVLYKGNPYITQNVFGSGEIRKI